MTTPKDKIKKEKSLLDFALGQRENAQKPIGTCSKIYEAGRTTLVDVPPVKDADAENGLADMDDKEFIELMGIES